MADSSVQILFVPMSEETSDVVALVLEAFIEKEHVITINIIFSKFKIRVWFGLILECLICPEHFHVAVLGFGDGGWNSILSLDELFIISHIKLTVSKSVHVDLLEFAQVLPFFNDSTFRCINEMLRKRRAFYFLQSVSEILLAIFRPVLLRSDNLTDIFL